MATKKKPTSYAIVLFGGAGDLAMRMLLPSLYHLSLEGRLGEGARVIGVGRHPYKREAYIEKVRAAVIERTKATYNVDDFATFAKGIYYQAADATKKEDMLALRELIGPEQPTVFFLSTSPTLYPPICAAMKETGLADERSRIVIEKPIGRDLETCRIVNAAVGDVFEETQIFRIDHYLGKETVQNLLALRFANRLFEPMWNNLGIDHVQITVAETVGIGDRWPYYDAYGALRDMVQNHMLQLLCLVAMEPPSDMEATAVRAEKVKVLRALRPIDRTSVLNCTVRGQYRAGVVEGKAVPGYSEERGGESTTETFVALRADINNWRWAGVPFFMRTGKRMPSKRTDILIQFKDVPHSIFGGSRLTPNQLLIRLQPDEDISLLVMNKEQGGELGGMKLRPMPLSLTFGDENTMRRRIAYERMFYDVILGNQTLFVDREEVEQAWRWIDGISDGWEEEGIVPRSYSAGSWGPPGAFALVERFGRNWHE